MTETPDPEPKGRIDVALHELEKTVTELTDIADSLIARSSDAMNPQDTENEKAQVPKSPHLSVLFRRIENERQRICEVCTKLLDARKRLEL